MLAWSTETKKRADDAAAAAKKKAEDAEQARLLALEQQRQHDEAAARAADEERTQRREKIFTGERALLTMAGEWRSEAENSQLEDSANKIALLLSHLTDLLATCITQQAEILALDNSVAHLQDRLPRVEQRPVAAADAGSSNTADRLTALEMRVGSLQDGAQLQQTTTQQLQQRICTTATTSSPEPRETAPKFDGQEIFHESIKTDPIPWFCKFELTLQLHNVKENKHHAYLYSRSGGACQAWLDNLLSKYGVVAADLHTMISWDDLKAAWHKRFQVEPPEIKAMDKCCIPEEELEVLRAQLDDLLAKGWIRPSSSPYGAPVLFVRTKHKDLRLCIDYRKLNVQTVKNAGPLPHIDDLLERLGGAKYFSKLDLKSGYHQISIQPNDRYKTAFTTRYWHFEWVVMPFGLTNAPTTFQAAMTNEFRAMLDRFVLVYLDDILVYGRTLADHLGHLRRVLETLCRAKYKANRDKCEFVRQELEYLGHFVTPKGMSPLSDKIQAVQEWSEPRNVVDVRSFFGLTSYYQRFIKGYSKIAAHLNKLQCEDRPFDFGEEARGSFLTLKVALLSAEVLRIYDPLALTHDTTDASGYGIGAVLEQHDGVDWHPVEYISKKVPLVHSIDDARKEFLAFVHALKRWRHFLLGRSQFRWVTDNNPLVFYKTQDTVNSTIAQSMAFIDQFDFFPDHIPGKSNRFADALSRRPDHCTAVYSTSEIDDDLRNSFISSYQADPEFCDKYANCSSPTPAPSHYRIQEGYLFVHTRGKDLLCVPSDPHLRTRLLGEFHDAPATGHFGVNRTIGRFRQRFWWPGLLGDVTRYCESCEVCRRCKSRNHRPYDELRQLPVPLRRREAIAMDITGPFPKHKTGVDGILTVVNRLTKFAMFLPCRYHAKAPELAEVLYAGWIRTKGYRKEIVCDRDTRFMSDFWLALIKRWGSSLEPNSARHPQTDGQTERAHQTAQVLLRTLIRPDQKDWVEQLSDVELAYNSSIHPAIGISPFEFEHGSPVMSPLDTITPRTAESDDHLLFLRGSDTGGGRKESPGRPDAVMRAVMWTNTMLTVQIHEGRQLQQTQQKDAAALTAAVRTAATHQQQQQQLLSTTTARVNNIEAKASAAPGCTTDTAKQLNERIDHVVSLIGELEDFTSPATISSTVATIKTDITKLQSQPAAAAKVYKMPRFNIGKFEDYNKTDALTGWQAFLTEASCHKVPAEDMMKAIYLQLFGGAQAWMNHLAVNKKTTIAELHKHLTWEDFEQLWFTRFMVRNVVKAAMNEVYTCSQGSMPTRDWTIKWQKIVTTPGFDLSFTNQRSEFFSRSCAGLRTALGNEYDYASFQAILDRANLVIQTGDKAANEKQSQQHYVAKQGYQRPAHNNVVISEETVDLHAAAASSSDGGIVAALPSKRPKRVRKNKATQATTSTGTGQQPWTAYKITKEVYDLRQRIEENVDLLTAAVPLDWVRILRRGPWLKEGDRVAAPGDPESVGNVVEVEAGAEENWRGNAKGQVAEESQGMGGGGGEGTGGQRWRRGGPQAEKRWVRREEMVGGGGGEVGKGGEEMVGRGQEEMVGGGGGEMAGGGGREVGARGRREPVAESRWAGGRAR
ncbi:hypothetical protein CBR_g51957 [Chara braunii]|uniref:Reverse transcriptase n=1 Tax=Chara braunii TaxID=69332 RepID=A0A388K6J2_CHABU|nr:hypothetical protein CBR_g51957 [Chara braunii]|eukprot:GBG65657.1 hypothetical protein CBR_g51957 [Chara braunii]